MKKIIVLLPTYNEKENIGEMIETLESKIFPKIKKFKMNILVVDDNSNDGTYDIVLEKIEKYRNIKMIRDEKKGLGEAFIRGIKFAIKEMGADVIIKMDADFQHDPKNVLDLINEYKKGNNYVIGSRYINGGQVPNDWGFYRKLLSKYGGLCTRITLFFPNINIVKDVSSGLKLIDVDNVLSKIDLSRISSGYCYTTQLMYYAIKLGIKIKEIPIKFRLREKGKTKMPFSNIPTTLKTIILLRFFDNRYIKKT